VLLWFTFVEHGEVFTFGDGANGQLGHGNKLLEISEPYAIKWNQPTKIVQVCCGEGHTALVSGIGCCLYFAFLGNILHLLFDSDCLCFFPVSVSVSNFSSL